MYLKCNRRRKDGKEERGEQGSLVLFSSDREIPATVAEAIGVRLSEFVLKRPRQWGACWLFTELWGQLGLRKFWREKLGCSREGTDWEDALEVLVASRLIDPAVLWQLYMLLTQIEEAFRNLKGDLSVRPIYHQLDNRIEAHTASAMPSSFQR